MTKPRTPIGFLSFNGLVSKAVGGVRVNSVAKAASNPVRRSPGSVASDEQELPMAAVKALRARFAPKNKGKTSWL